MEMLVTGEAIDAATAETLGLVNRVVSSGGLDEAVADLTRKIVAKSPLTLAIGKQAFYAQIEMPVADAYGYASAVMTRNMLARDAQEGIDAFIAKRQPEWKGR
jgi:enoyl-CoA hydratase/carnithine racemase